MTEAQIRIRDSLDTLSASEKMVGEYILQNFEHSITLPIAELSESSGISRSTWIRFSKSMGYSGLKELKRAMVRQLSSLASADGNTTDGSVTFSDLNFDGGESACLSIKNNYILSLEETFNLLNVDSIRQVAELCVRAQSIGLFGMGASAIVAQDLHHKLLRIGVRSIYTQEFFTNLTAAATMEKDDIAIFFSNSGQTKELIELASIAKKHGCAVVAVTKHGKTGLSNLATHVLYTSTPEREIRSSATSSRIAQLFIVDVLFTTIAKMNYNKAESKLLESYAQAQTHKLDSALGAAQA